MPAFLNKHICNLILDKTASKCPGATPLYKLYRYVPPRRVGFLGRFGLKTGEHFARFGLESGMVFEPELRGSV